jgi:hypothetical protein
MRRLGIYILVLVLLLLVTSFLLFSLNRDKIEITSPSDSVRIDSLRLCGVASVSKDLQKVSICGSVVADKPTVPIRMYLYEMPDKNLVAENQVSDRFSPGEFIREFDLPDSNNSSSYKIVAYFYKNIVGEVEFEIHNP